jgi:hypothetical protein
MRSLVKALAKLSPTQVRQLLASAPRSGQLDRLERERDQHLKAVKKLDRKIAKLSGGNGHAAAPARKRRRRKMSAETRRKMSEAAKRRHAGNGKPEAAPAEGKAMRKPFSAETKAKMAAAQKARWAKVKGSQSPAQPST